MKIKGLLDEDFVNYKLPSMFIAANVCDWKCCKEANLPIEVCQNCSLAQAETIDIPVAEICHRYVKNPITKAMVVGGLEPMLQQDDLLKLIEWMRSHRYADDIVIYTGYREDEIQEFISKVKPYGNIVIKFGRFIPNQHPHYDEVLGVKLASNNQKGVRIC